MDRIIRKQLKSNPNPPLVPPSEWNHLDDEVKESDEKKIVTPVKKEAPPKRLIEVIEEKSGEVVDEGSRNETSRNETSRSEMPLSETPLNETPNRIDGEPTYPSLLLVNKQEKPQPPNDGIPTISKHPENLSQTMKSHIAATVLSWRA